jgi:hypothetical protein
VAKLHGQRAIIAGRRLSQALQVLQSNTTESFGIVRLDRQRAAVAFKCLVETFQGFERIAAVGKA